MVEHSSCLEEADIFKLKDELKIDDIFLDEQLLATSQDVIP